MIVNQPYFMDNALEGPRLEAKCDAAATEGLLVLAGLRPGMRALDVGSGTGAVSRLMSKIAGPGQVVGVDITPSLIGQARSLAAAAQLDIEFVEGNAVDLPLPSGHFDFSWARFLFEYLPD